MTLFTLRLVSFLASNVDSCHRNTCHNLLSVLFRTGFSKSRGRVTLNSAIGTRAIPFECLPFRGDVHQLALMLPMFAFGVCVRSQTFNCQRLQMALNLRSSIS